MFTPKKDDTVVMQAIKAANNGDHLRASKLFRDAGNQIRRPEDKKALWNASERHLKTHYSD